MNEFVDSEVAETDAAETVRRYLRLVEARDLEAATRVLDPDVTITFPGGRKFKTLEDQVASSGLRFRSVRKSFEQFDTIVVDERVVVYVFGTLDGIAVDGRSFASVRYLDRFELRDGRIVSQMVWNDLAETGVLKP
jgi:ketosteroid isomerase-like protein